MVVNEVCGSENSKQKNIGAKKQCLEAPVKTYAVAREGFAFDSVEDAKDRAKWMEAIQNKDIVPFPYVEGIEPNNTDATIRNGRFRDYTLKEAVRGSSYRQDLSICTYESVKSYENSEYTRIFRITADEEFTCEVMEDGKVKGEPLTSFIVGVRNEATDDDVPFCNVQLKYKKDLFSILKAGFDISELEGVMDVSLTQVSASATSIKVKATVACTGATINSLTAENFIVRDADGGVVDNTSFVAPNGDGVYEFTGTGFVSGFTVELNGVVTQADILYETPEPLEITIS